MKKRRPTYRLILIFSLLMGASFSYGSNLLEGKRLNKEGEGHSVFSKAGIFLLKDGLYFASIPLFKEVLYRKEGKLGKSTDKYLDRLIDHVGMEHFNKLPVDLLSKSNSAFIKYIVAKKYFKLGKYKNALLAFKGIPKDHRVYPQKLFLEGSIFYFQKKFSRSIKTYRKCIKSAKKIKSSVTRFDLEKKYQFIADSCDISIARVYYKGKKVKRARKHFQKISVNSYKWPSLLLEDAWASFRLKNYNKTVGRLLTYKSPILSSYIFPEAEILKAMSYTELCLWNEAAASIENFNKLYVENGKRLIKLLNSKGSNYSFFNKMLTRPNDKAFNDFVFLKNMISNIRNRPYYLTKIYQWRKSSQELRKIKKKPEGFFKSTLLRNINQGRKEFQTQMAQFTREHLLKIANDIIQTSKDLMGIQLEVYSRQKEQLYKSDKVSLYQRGTLKNIERDPAQHFWSFKQEFWIDELGHYVLPLESRCSSKKGTRK